MKETEKKVDPQLWQACAGSIVQIPQINSTVYYFPQGHAEHSQTPLNFLSNMPSLILCRVTSVNHHADSETDEVYTRIRLAPIPNSAEIEELGGSSGSDTVSEKPASFAKTLTQSDANNGGGFSVPRYCAETIFPRLDYSADPPVQTVVARDVHGELWKFRHIYRGTPRRHLLTTGWSNFVNQKKLVAGDAIVFLRAENGDLCVGIRRAKREGFGAGNVSGGGCSFGGFSLFGAKEESAMAGRNVEPRGGGGGWGRVKAEEVLEAAGLAAKGRPFEVVYYPRASTPEYCVKTGSVRAAMRVHWCSGMRFKMAFETEDSSRISWFMGTVSSVQVADPIRWPGSPWRLLQGSASFLSAIGEFLGPQYYIDCTLCTTKFRQVQILANISSFRPLSWGQMVTWDEPDLLQNVKRVSPWLVELASNMPAINLPPFSPPRKKLRLTQLFDFPLDGQFQLPSFSGNPLGPSSPMCYLSDNAPAGIQGARHAQYGISLTDLQLNNKLQSGLFLSSFQRFEPHSRISQSFVTSCASSCNDNISCWLTMGNSGAKSEKSENVKKHQFVLFGQPILTEQQISRDCSSDPVKPSNEILNGTKVFEVVGSAPGKPIPRENLSFTGFSWNHNFHAKEFEVDTGHCKVFMELEDVGRTLDLSVLGSYEELETKLAAMFGIERAALRLGHVLYRDASGAVKQIGDEPFSVFAKTAKRLTIMTSPSANDNIERTWITGMRNAESGLEASNKAGPLSIFA